MTRKWTDEEKRIVREIYPDHLASEIAAMIGKTVSGVQQMARSLGVRASKERVAETGRRTAQNPNSIAARFKKGHIPETKGKKMPSEVYEKIRHTMFAKGHVPTNHKPVGSERVSVDGYVEVKVAEPNKWRLKHRLVWEEAHGPIPPGHNIQFRDGNRQNLSLDNLYMISRAEQCAKENSFHARYPEELKAVIRLKGSIKRQITEYNKKRQKEHGKEC
jgi:hypothetical protein